MGLGSQPVYGRSSQYLRWLGWSPSHFHHFSRSVLTQMVVDSAIILWIIESFHSHLTSAQTNGTPSSLDTPIINCSECVCCSLFASSIRQVHIHTNYFSVGFQWKKHIAGKPCASIFPGLQLPQRGCLQHIRSLAPCFTPSPWHRGQPKQLVAPARCGIGQPPLGMRQSLTKKAELMFPRSKEKGRCLSRALPLPVVSPRLAVNLGCLSDPKLSSHVHRKTDASHSRAPCSSQAPSAKPAGRVHSWDSRDTASCLWPLWACDTALSIPCISLPPCQGLAACGLLFLCGGNSHRLRSQTGSRGQALQALWLKQCAWGTDDKAGKQARSPWAWAGGCPDCWVTFHLPALKAWHGPSAVLSSVSLRCSLPFDSVMPAAN